MSSSSIRKRLESILKLNRKGTNLIHAKKYAKAAAIFTNCLTKTKEMLSISVASEEPQCSLSFRFQSDPSSSQRESDSTDESATNQEVHTSFQSPILMVMEDVRRLRRSSSSSSSLCKSNTMLSLSFAILYNIAISFHMSALHSHEEASCQRRLQKALTLYEAAHQLLENKSLLSVGVLETMALLNNMAQVHSRLGNQTQSQECYEQMLQSVMWVTHVGDKRNVFQFDLFFDNAMTHLLRPSQSAAAA